MDRLTSQILCIWPTITVNFYARVHVLCYVALHVLVIKMDCNLCTSAIIVIFILVSHACAILPAQLHTHQCCKVTRYYIQTLCSRVRQWWLLISITMVTLWKSRIIRNLCCKNVLTIGALQENLCNMYMCGWLVGNFFFTFSALLLFGLRNCLCSWFFFTDSVHKL